MSSKFKNKIILSRVVHGGWIFLSRRGKRGMGGGQPRGEPPPVNNPNFKNPTINELCLNECLNCEFINKLNKENFKNIPTEQFNNLDDLELNNYINKDNKPNKFLNYFRQLFQNEIEEKRKKNVCLFFF
jgi:hypothetical protein